jgi:hypothetical protein
VGAALLFGLASVLLFLLLLGWREPGLFDPIVATGLAWAAFLLHLTFSGRRLGAFDPGIWIPVLILVHYFGMPIAVDLLQDPEFVDYDAWNVGGPPKVTLSFAVALLTLTCFLAGFQAAGVTDQSRPAASFPPERRPLLGPALCLLLGGFAFMLIGIPLAGADLIFGSYGDYKIANKFADADLRFFGTGFIFANCGIYGLLAAHDPARRWRVAVALGCSAILAVFLLVAGNRGGLSVLALAGGWAFTQRVRKVPRWAVAVGFSFAMLGMPIIGEWRQSKELQTVEVQGAKHLAAAIFYEMGSTLPTFSYTLEYVPSQKPYDYGMSVINQLIINVPNLGLQVGRRFGLDPLAHDPDNWVTYVANPIKYERLLGGYGYSLGAEWYFNFGMIGVLVGMFLTGFATARVREAGRRSGTWLTFATLFYGMMLAIVRNDVGYPLRTVLWPLVGLLLLQLAWPRLGRTAYAGFAPRETGRALRAPLSPRPPNLPAQGGVR